jgi:hypothetical protein
VNTFENLSPRWQREVKRLRVECAQYRKRLQEAKQQIAELEAQIDVA